MKTSLRIDQTIQSYVSMVCTYMEGEMLLNELPFPLPTPSIFNLDQIKALTVDNLVSENGAALSFADLEIKPLKLKGYPTEFLVCYREAIFWLYHQREDG